MVIYLSMYIWTLLIWLLLSISQKRTNFRGETTVISKTPIWCAVLIVGYIIFWAGLRTQGADTITYINSFRAMPSQASDIRDYVENTTKGQGYALIQILFKTFISQDWSHWLMFNAVVTGGLVAYRLYKWSEDYAMSVLFFVMLGTFFWMINGIRQFMAVALLFAFSGWIVERKTIRVILLVLLASTIHTSILIFLPFYFILWMEPLELKSVLAIGAVLISAIVLIQIGGFMDEYEEQLAVAEGTNIFRVLVSWAPVALMFWKKKIIMPKATPVIKMCMHMTSIAACLYLWSMFTSGILIGRLPLFFDLFLIVLYPWLITNAFEERERQAWTTFIVAGYSLYFLYQIGFPGPGRPYGSSKLGIYALDGGLQFTPF